jgi:hypothetical protein
LIGSLLAQVSELVPFFFPAVPVPQATDKQTAQKEKNAAKRQKGGGIFAAKPQGKKEKVTAGPLGSAAWRSRGVKCIHQARCSSPPCCAKPLARTSAVFVSFLRFSVRLSAKFYLFPLVFTSKKPHFYSF